MIFDFEPDIVGFYLLLVALMFLTAIPVWIRIKQHRFDLFEPPVWLSLYCVVVFGLFSIPPLHGWVPVHSRLSPVSYWLGRAIGAVVLGVGCMWIGYSLPLPGSHRRVRVPSYPDQTVKLPWLLTMSGVGMGLRLYMLSHGYFGYLMVRDAYFGNLAESQTVSQLSVLSQWGFILAAIDFYRHPESLRRRVLFVVLLGLEFVFAAVGGFKGTILFTGVLVVIVYFHIRGRLPVAYLTLAVLAVVVFTPINLAYRNLINRNKVDRTDITAVVAVTVGTATDQWQDQGPGQLLLQGPLHLLQRLTLLPDVALAMEYIDRTGDLWCGKTYAYLPLYAVVPRYLWSDKPVSELGYWFSYAVLGNPRWEHLSEAPMLPGELYLNFGLPGVCAGFLLLGLLLRFVYQRYALRGDLSYLFVYIVLWLNFKGLEFDVLPWGAGLIRQIVLVLLIRRFAFVPVTPQESKVSLEAGSCEHAIRRQPGMMPANR